jgi:DNA-binding MarR family transcriptional regulator
MERCRQARWPNPCKVKSVDKKPSKIEHEWSKTEELYVLSNKDSGKTASLDQVSFLIWVSCDGKTSIEQIVDILSVDGNRDIIRANVTGILDKLEKSELIKWG